MVVACEYGTWRQKDMMRKPMERHPMKKNKTGRAEKSYSNREKGK